MRGGVVEWVDSQPADVLAVTSVTAGELRCGAERMPAGKRKEALREQIEADAQIAAICAATGSQLVTRNVDVFASLDIPVVNPWP